MQSTPRTRSQRLGRLPALCAATLAALLIQFQPTPAARATEEEVPDKVKVGDTAPDFTLRDLAGQEVRLSSLAGEKVVLLAFAALRCGTCLEETPHLEALHRKYAERGLAVLYVNVDGVDARTFTETMKDVGIAVSFTVLLDPDFVVTDAYTNAVVPFTVLIDRTGVIRYVHTSYAKGDEQRYEEAILQSLGS